ncbi:MAG: hypothetical protein WBV71_04855 [Roseobacter sp.]
MRSHLQLAHDQDTHQDQPLRGCQRIPVWWTPHSGVEHSGTTIGVKFHCPKCGVEGQAEFGPAQTLPVIAAEALYLFLGDADVQATCVLWDQKPLITG